MKILSVVTADQSILNNIDLVAMTQDELYDILDEDSDKVYLYGEKYEIPLGKKNICYIGINKPLVILEKGKNVGDYNNANIFFNDIKFEDEVNINSKMFFKEAIELYNAKKYESAFPLIKKLLIWGMQTHYIGLPNYTLMEMALSRITIRQ